MSVLISLSILAGLGLGLGDGASASARADDRVDYARQVKPVLQARCYACHGVLKQKAGLRLDTAALALKGSKSQAVIVPGDAEASVLIERVSAPDESERMPPEGEPLKPSEVAALRAWIDQGANAPGDEPPERDPREHWAFQTPTRPAVPTPTVENLAWVKNPIDAFIAAGHQKHGLTPQPPADRRVWLRRVSLDLIGLPPTREELDAFLADDSAQAYDTVVERLLASPQYGQRWGRHWMDIWRYSDWWGLGAEVRNSQKHIWHWRDWIIESLNADKGYDQMLREMLAADELYPTDPDTLRATGFLARQYFKFNRTSWLDETIEHTAKAMLGLTFNCAKCHDHKYDPIAQVQYYQFRAFFEPYQIRTDAVPVPGPVPGPIDFEKDGIPRAFDCNLEAPTFLHVRGDDRNPDKSRVIEPGFPPFLALGAPPPRIEPVPLPDEASHPGLRPFVVDLYLKTAEQQIAEARTGLEAARKSPPDADAKADAKAEPGPDELPAVIAEKTLIAAQAQLASIKARAAADRARYQQPSPEDRSCLIAAAVRAERVAAAAKADEDLSRAELDVLRATPEKKGEAEKKLVAARAAFEAARKAIDVPGDEYTPLAGALKTLESNLETEASRRKPFPKTSTGRRSALARWITDPKHPLTARVAVNHLWSRHFGRPLVPTVFDFGRKGTPPTHPELLDWLAVELVERGFSMKAIHRLIVTSNTYRLTSSTAGVASETLASDPDNRFYWRANPIRMEAQLVRDSLLSLAGDLDLTHGGPSIPVNQDSSRRRSLYFVHSHNEHQAFLATFDDASVLECYRRAESVVPQQALALENSPLATAMAEKIAQRITAANPDASDHDFIRAAFLTVLSVEPTPAEEVAVRDALTRLTGAARGRNRENPEMRAKVYLVHALLNHNDFVTVR
jgi:hypothetical protein